MSYTYCRPYGGSIHEVLYVARHSENNTWLVIHRSFYKAGSTRAIATPLEIFQGSYIPVRYDTEGKRWVKGDNDFPFPEPSPEIPPLEDDNARN